MKKIVPHGFFALLITATLFSCKKDSLAQSNANNIYKNLVAADFTAKVISFSTTVSANVDDLMPIKNIFGSKQIVGIGEATHGTAEFQTAKHRSFQLLATQLQFKNLVIEENFSAVVPLNNFITTGSGDVTSLINSLRSSIFKTIEFKNLVVWMKDYNTGKADADKLQLYGMDAQNTGYSAKAAQAMISAYEPSYLNTYNQLAGSFLVDLTDFSSQDAAIAALPSLKQKIENITQHITSNSTIYINNVGQKKYELLIQHLSIIRQTINQYIGFTTSNNRGFEIRDENMATNIKWIESYNGIGSKIMVWVHNGHINLQKQDYFGSGSINVLGTNLKTMYGNKFYSTAFIFNEGKFDAINANTGNSEVFTIKPTLKTVLTNALSQFKLPCFFYDFTDNASNSILHSIFNSNYLFLQLGAGYDNKIENALWEYNLTKEFDGFIYIDKTTAITAL